MISKGENKAKKFLNKDIPVFAFFLFISFALWYLNELSKELEATINYPVRYVNPSKDRIIIGKMPHKLALELRGPGFSILKLKLSGSKAPVVIDFSKLSSKRLPGKTPNYFVSTSNLIEDFSKQLHADYDILSIKPDTLTFGYDRVVTRRLPVIPSLRTESAPDNKVIVVSVPDSVSVTGPLHIIDTTAGIYTKFKTFQRMDETFKTSALLICPEYFSISEKRVILEITVLERPSPFFNLRYHKDNPKED